MKKEKAIILNTQVSGKLPKYTDPTGQLIYKSLSPGELQFYEKMKNTHVSSMDSHLQNFIPQYVGTQNLHIPDEKSQKFDSPCKQVRGWIDHISRREKYADEEASYLVLKNLTLGFQETCIMDIKLGRKLKAKASNKKFATSTTNSHNFRINGMKNFNNKTGESSFVNKYYFQKTTEQEIESHLAYFFFDGQKVDTQLISECVAIVKKMVFSLLSFKGGSFHSSSLLICYDGKNHSSFAVKLIDFDKYIDDDKDQSDHNIIEGLKYIVSYLSHIIQDPQAHQDLITRKQLRFFEQKNEIPEWKLPKTEQEDNYLGNEIVET